MYMETVIKRVLSAPGRVCTLGVVGVGSFHTTFVVHGMVLYFLSHLHQPPRLVPTKTEEE